MLALHGVLPSAATARPPVLLVHGAANSALVWTFWQRELAARGFASYAVDLRGHGSSAACDLSAASMQDYADDVLRAAETLREPPVAVGWSMGGLVAMLAASGTLPVRAVVGLAPSTPARDRDPSAPLRTGEFGAEEYGITTGDPDDQPTMPDLDREERLVALASLCRESRLARDERAAGVVIEALPCPLLIVTGTADTQWPRSRYGGLHLRADHVTAEGASHWGLVLNRRVLPGLVVSAVDWMGRT